MRLPLRIRQQRYSIYEAFAPKIGVAEIILQQMQASQDTLETSMNSVIVLVFFIRDLRILASLALTVD